MVRKEKVILRRIDGYNSSDITRITKEGRVKFNLSPRCKGTITIKSTVVMAHHNITPCNYTRSEFLDGLLITIRDGGRESTNIAGAEKCGAGIPSSRMLKRAWRRLPPSSEPHPDCRREI